MTTLRRSLPQCEFIKQRKNLLRICGMALKSVVDKFCFNGVLDDTDPDVRNLLVILENVLMHRCKQKGPSSWFSDEVTSYWPCIVASCSKVRRSCVPIVTGMGGRHLTGLAMGRIFLQMALMERRLSEYLSELVGPESTDLLRKAYEPEAFLLKDEGAALPHMCLGLNAIDFSFCPKGENLDYQYIPCIDFTPYLDFTPCAQAELDDEHEQAVLSGAAMPSTPTEDSPDENWRAKFQALYVKYRELGQQKSYAEDMLTLKQARIEKLEFDLAAMQGDSETTKALHGKEINQLQLVVAELQAELQSVGRDRSTSDRRGLELFLTGLSRNGKFHEAIALKNMPDEPEEQERSLSFVTVDGVSLDDEFERSPYGSAMNGSAEGGMDALERVMTGGVPPDHYAADGNSLQPLTGSITQPDDDQQ
ncbi:putative RUN domain-containing protein 3A [Hypsibius exemplaris]|uniref:RUN domain-containing protein 3A n=1 Tax=Hypsibius exemplaris TaxID=2072580 RepID=A0A1W0X2A6_HYPEX|nr:putative RUN domain-containing protein 3A [Hypsibius exemplaris]